MSWKRINQVKSWDPMVHQVWFGTKNTRSLDLKVVNSLPSHVKPSGNQANFKMPTKNVNDT